ncbi:MAG: membrane protein insertion efficiency factor YidD [bacterium]|nr:membrane protein insertion efficiency factor YidD [bacterium]
MLKRACKKLIRLYQKTLSPDHGPLRRIYPYGCCKYYPSCSEYTIRAIEHRGIARGVGLGFVRILRCNPFCDGGIDLSYKKNAREVSKESI